MAASADLLQRATEGAEKILTQCLRLEHGDMLTLFWDETTCDVKDILLYTGQQIGLKVEDCLVSLEEQRKFRSPPGLSEHHLRTLEDARGILTCTSGDAQATNFRKELITRGTNADARLGHMPGATLDDLAHAAIDHLQAERRCEELALAMALGRKVELTSYIPDDKGNRIGEHKLFLDLHGLERAPITSTGIIPLGTWGNIPGAETFIAPWEESAEGTFVLNGSFPGRVMPSGRYLLLTFQAGYLIDVKGDEELACSFSHFFEVATPIGSVCHKAVAELYAEHTKYWLIR